MAAPVPQELAQCIAFAYFADNPRWDESPADDTKNPHSMKFYELFNNDGKLGTYKEKYLSSQFPLDYIKRTYRLSKTELTGKVVYNITLRKVYKVVKQFLKTTGMSASKLNAYRFYDQNDPFTMLIKDRTLENIKIAFGFSKTTKIDVLSAVDIFIVSRYAQSHIKNSFNLHFANTETILNNALWKTEKSYSEITRKFMDAGELFPISLKLPNQITAQIRVKKVDFTNNKKETNIDPYMKLLSAILAEPGKAAKYIQTVIDIDYKAFDIGRLLNWVFPVNFNYSHLIDPATGKKMEDHNLRFNLFAQGYGVGWNGQFSAVTREHAATQWVGGIGVEIFEKLMDEYPEYKNIVKSLVKIRKEAFDEVNEMIVNSDFDSETRSNLDGVITLDNANTIKKELSTMRVIHRPDQTKKITEYFRWIDLILNLGPVNSTYAKYMDLVALKISSKARTAKLHAPLVPKWIYPKKRKDVQMKDRIYKAKTVKEISKKELLGKNGEIIREKVIIRPASYTPSYKVSGKLVIGTTPPPFIEDYADAKNKIIKAHYVHSQVSLFLFPTMGNTTEYLRERIFLSLFGIVTKKSHKSFKLDSTGFVEMKAIIRNSFMKDNVKHIAEFQTAPHYIIS